MFTKAIETVGGFTRPIKIISRKYKDKSVLPGAATLFFVNDEGCAITCKHVANELILADQINENYSAFKAEAAVLPNGNKKKAELKKLEHKYNLNYKTVVELKAQFVDCAEDFTGIEIISHAKYDVSIIKFKGYRKLSYEGHAVFKKNGNLIQPGNMLCRLGFPFPEFSNYEYNEEIDEIDWTSSGRNITPRFPIDGMVTRHFAEPDGSITGIEISTPGLRGQSGGPLFDQNGIVFGMQSMTNHLHLGFDQVNVNLDIGGVQKKISNQPFLHVGQCVHVEIIKDFLNSNNIKYYEGESINTASVVNG